jgi:surface protein
MFKVASEFDQDIGTWNVARVESFGRSCSSAASGTSCEASTLGGMFFEALKFNRDLRNWNVASVTDMYPSPFYPSPSPYSGFSLIVIVA